MSFQDILLLLSTIVSILGIPIAILVFVNEKRKERRDREYGTYHALDEKYLEYLGLCMTYPELDLYWIPLERQVDYTPEQKIRRYAFFEMIIALMERAYLMYQDQSTEIKRSQWSGWHTYIVDWFRRDEFRQLWALLGEDYDLGFMNYINGIMDSLKEEKEINSPNPT